MECELYVLNDGKLQCGNCGELMDEPQDMCAYCGAKVIDIVDEGEADDSIWE